MSDFNVGDRVVYVSGRHGTMKSNPLVGSKYECEGTIDYSDRVHTNVLWDNGTHNSYTPNDLMLIGKGKVNPNREFSLKKRNLRR